MLMSSFHMGPLRIPCCETSTVYCDWLRVESGLTPLMFPTQSGDSPDVTRAANTPKATSTADLVDSGIIPTGDEASASSQGSVSRSASDVSSKSK